MDNKSGQPLIDQVPPTRHVDTDIAISNLLPERVLRITAMGVDKYGLHILYEITPPINPAGWDDVIKAESAQYIWFLSGQDDRGNQYDEGGGVYTLALDGQRTEGERTLQPAPAADASWLDLSFFSPLDEQPFEHPRCMLRARFPLTVDSSAVES